MQLAKEYNTVIKRSIDDVVKRLKIDKGKWDHCLIILGERYQKIIKKGE